MTRPRVRPDARLSRGGASCSLWWTRTPWGAAGRVGFIGDWRGDGAPAREIVRRACNVLRRKGCALAAAPVDGTTWSRYRVIVGSAAGAASFFLEHVYPRLVAEPFLEEGFQPLATYRSESVVLDAGDSGVTGPPGFRMRPLEPACFDAELGRLHSLARAAFAGALLYTPMGERAFRAAYAPLRPWVEPRLVWFAEHAGRPVGFAFAIRAPEHPATVVVKTIAVLPAFRGRGLGSALIARVHAVARSLGAREVIHALAHEANVSTRLTQGRGRTLRRYAVLGRSTDAAPWPS